LGYAEEAEPAQYILVCGGRSAGSITWVKGEDAAVEGCIVDGEEAGDASAETLAFPFLVSRGNQGLGHGEYLRLSGSRCLSKLLLRCEGGNCALLKHSDWGMDLSDLQRQSWVARRHVCLLHLPVELRD
jgi:hypothetical protein